MRYISSLRIVLCFLIILVSFGNSQAASIIIEDVLFTSGADADIAPGTGGGTFRDIRGVQFLDDGSIGLSAHVGGGTVNVSEGVFLIDPNGFISEIVLANSFGSGQGTPVPDGGGATFLRAGDPGIGGVSFDQAGNVLFGADTIGGTLGFTRGLWKWANGQPFSYHGDITLVRNQYW